MLVVVMSLHPSGTGSAAEVDRFSRWTLVRRLELIASPAEHLGRSAPRASSSLSRSECVCRSDRLLMPAAWLTRSRAAPSTRAGLP